MQETLQERTALAVRKEAQHENFHVVLTILIGERLTALSEFGRTVEQSRMRLARAQILEKDGPEADSDKFATRGVSEMGTSWIKSVPLQFPHQADCKGRGQVLSLHVFPCVLCCVAGLPSCFHRIPTCFLCGACHLLLAKSPLASSNIIVEAVSSDVKMIECKEHVLSG